MRANEMLRLMIAALTASPRPLLFCELVAVVGPEAKGGLAVFVDPNIIVWDDVSEEFLKAVKLLSPLTEINRADPEAFTQAGAELPKYPVAASVPGQAEFRTVRGIHWAPIQVRLKSRPPIPYVQNSSQFPSGGSVGKVKPGGDGGDGGNSEGTIQ